MQRSSLSWFEQIQSLLDEREERGRMRQLSVVNRPPSHDFCSNDYLGLRHHPELIRETEQYLHAYGTGAGASSLVSGYTEVHEQLRTALANWLNAEDVVLFPSGYQLNLSVLPTLIKKEHVVLMDRFCHNSIIQGVIQSGARFKRFPHNDLTTARRWAEKEREENPEQVIWLCTESVFSMDGDSPDMKEVQKLAEDLDILLYVDEAHAYGVLGEQGAGLLKRDAPVRIGTFGKSFASQGAFISCSKSIARYLVNFAGGLMYSTALTPVSAGTALASLQLIKDADQQRSHISHLVQTFHECMKDSDKDIMLPEKPSYIYPIILGDSHRAMHVSTVLQEQGWGVVAIRPPTVPDHTARIRLSFHANHTQEDVLALANSIKHAL